MFKKIVVVGTSSSGKSTMAKKLSKALQIEYFDLDDLFWLPNWTKKEESQFLKDIDNRILTKPQWIIAGIMENLFYHMLTPLFG